MNALLIPLPDAPPVGVLNIDQLIATINTIPGPTNAPAATWAWMYTAAVTMILHGTSPQA